MKTALGLIFGLMIFCLNGCDDRARSETNNTTTSDTHISYSLKNVEQVIIFYGQCKQVQEDVNKWLEDKGTRIEITRILQSDANSSGWVTISIFFKVKP